MAIRFSPAEMMHQAKLIDIQAEELERKAHDLRRLASTLRADAQDRVIPPTQRSA